MFVSGANVIHLIFLAPDLIRDIIFLHKMSGRSFLSGFLSHKILLKFIDKNNKYYI